MVRLTENHLRFCFPKNSKQNKQVFCYSYFPFLFPFTAKNTSIWAFPVKDPPATVGDARVVGSVPWLGRSFGAGDGNLLHYGCLGNPIRRET